MCITGEVCFPSLEQAPILFHHRVAAVSVHVRADGRAAHGDAPSLHQDPHGSLAVLPEEEHATGSKTLGQRKHIDTDGM